MPRKIAKGDRVKVEGGVSRIGTNGYVTIWIRGYEYPITLHEKYLDEVVPGPKEPKPRFKKIYDNPPHPKPSNKKRPATD
ncbi:hypothetical protein CN093_08955 [Sinorhizobium meliloti]|uniref:hypothetical protein n=1 Tax=Rhizobium meliloti TaxID=382 RepID=UPI000FD24DB7|nr:hypothetical protein [Sinorhizobium meliloti]RVO41377.1 hypothetical protein CN093_08955 [Sinorhizobium meliloti]